MSPMHSMSRYRKHGLRTAIASWPCHSDIHSSSPLDPSHNPSLHPGGPVGSMAEAWSGRAASSGLAFLLVTLLAISTGIVRQGNAQPIFDRLTQRETTCQYRYPFTSASHGTLTEACA